MIQRRPLLILLFSIFCLIAAYMLRKMIYEIVIIPLAYLWWLITLYYHVIPQAAIWIALICAILFTSVRGLLMEIPLGKAVEIKKQKVQGPIEALSQLVHKTDKGIYYKWLIANRLGKTAREILDQRESRQVKQKFTRLTGRDWDPPEDVAAYLESGVNGSFADYPQKGWRVPRTPLDVSPRQVIEYLESELENNRNGHR